MYICKMDKEALELLRENNRMLKEITGYIRTVSGQIYRDQEDMRQFCINVAADVFTEALEDKKRDNILNAIRK